MPRTRATRKADANRSQTTADKVKEVTEVTPKEHLQAVIRDMQCQIPRIIDLTCKKYEREALKCVRLLPDKSTIPPEIYNMPLTEFIIKGGTMDLVMQSLREEKMKEFVNESTDWEVSTSTSQLPGNTETKICFDKENLTPREVELITPAKRMTTRSVANSTVKKAQENGTTQTKRTRGMAASTRKKRLLQEEQVDETNLVTPAMTSRSCTVVPSTVKRIPKQLEEVELMIKSKETGSPLNEKDTMEAIIFGAVDDCFKSLLPKLPKRAQTQAMKALEESLSGLKGRIRQDGNTVTMVTPSIASTRARRKK